MRPGPPARPGRGWELLLAILAALAAGAAGGYLVALRAGSADPRPEPPAVRAERVTALGRLQPAGGVVPVYGPPADRIAELFPVPVGKELREGARVARLASFTEREQQVKVAEAQLAEAEKALAAAGRAGEQKILAARAELAQARANKDSDLAAVDARLKFLAVQKQTADAGVARVEKIRAEAEVLEKARLQAALAEAELRATEAARKKTETSYEEGEKAAAAKVAAAEAELAEAKARAPIESAREQVALAKQLRDRAEVKAPVTGVVLKVTGREGQPTGAEPILQMADVSAMTAVAEVYESDVERLGKWLAAGPVKAEVRTPALPRPLAGTVRSAEDIARLIARNQVFALGPREDADRRVVEVVVHLSPADAEPAGRLVGLQVTVTLEPGAP
jgi:HlyD family secretion protein